MVKCGGISPCGGCGPFGFLLAWFGHFLPDFSGIWNWFPEFISSAIGNLELVSSRIGFGFLLLGGGLLLCGAIARNVCAMKKWPEKGCALREDVSGVGHYRPEANARSVP